MVLGGVLALAFVSAVCARLLGAVGAVDPANPHTSPRAAIG
jgi:hypothetical protein